MPALRFELTIGGGLRLLVWPITREFFNAAPKRLSEVRSNGVKFSGAVADPEAVDVGTLLGPGDISNQPGWFISFAGGTMGNPLSGTALARDISDTPTASAALLELALALHEESDLSPPLEKLRAALPDLQDCPAAVIGQTVQVSSASSNRPTISR